MLYDDVSTRKLVKVLAREVKKASFKSHKKVKPNQNPKVKLYGPQ